MPKLPSFLDHPIKSLEEALSIRKQIAALQDRLQNLFGGRNDQPSIPVPTTRRGRKRRRRTMSADARARIGAAQRAKWAERKGGAAKATAVAKPARRAKKRVLTPEGRAKLSRMMADRWAARRKAAGAAAPKAKK